MIKEDEVPTNNIGGSSSTAGPVQTFDPLLSINTKKKRSTVLKRKLNDVVSIPSLADLKKRY